MRRRKGDRGRDEKLVFLGRALGAVAQAQWPPSGQLHPLQTLAAGSQLRPEDAVAASCEKEMAGT